MEIEDAFHPIYREHNISESIIVLPASFDTDALSPLDENFTVESLLGIDTLREIVMPIITGVSLTLWLSSAAIVSSLSTLFGPAALLAFGAAAVMGGGGYYMLSSEKVHKWTSDKLMTLDVPRTFRTGAEKKTMARIRESESELRTKINNSLKDSLKNNVEEGLFEQITHAVNSQAKLAEQFIQ